MHILPEHQAIDVTPAGRPRTSRRAGTLWGVGHDCVLLVDRDRYGASRRRCRPHVLTLLAAMPKFVTKRCQPHIDARAIADGLERRHPSVTIRGRWRPVTALRGVAGPVSDGTLARDPKVRCALSELDVR